MNTRRIHTVSSVLALIIVLVLSMSGAMAAPVWASPLLQTVDFDGEELLARPTDTSITINVVPNDDIELYYQYGTTSGEYAEWTSTPATSANGGEPHQIVITGLTPNTHYFYRMLYRVSGGSWVARSEHSFWTQRVLNSPFTFTITSDSHVNIMLGNAATWQQTMSNVADQHPDFHIDLGDTFAMDSVSSVAGAEQAYLYQRSFFNLVSHSAPIFLATGNHEQEEGWHLDDTGNPATSTPVLSANARKKFYPNPVPDEFYTGNSDPYSYLDGDHLREDYYSWEWGDALFVVFDPFWYTDTKPYTGNTGGGETSDPGSGDRWDWTLGQQQYNWFKQTLEESNARYKFVFAHHMVGGSDDYVRGGAVPAHLVEWGGYDENGTTWGFDTRRGGWEDTIHQIMMDNGVSAFFHGHDHQYAYEMRDGIVYQSLPAAGFSGNGFNIYNESHQYTIKTLPSPGHLQVTVTPTQATVGYYATTGGTLNYSYTIDPGSPGPTHELTLAVEPVGSGTTIPAVGVYTYEENDEVIIQADAVPGYQFDYWEGDVANPNVDITTVTMDEDKLVTAHFSVATYDLTMAVDPAGGGATTPAVGMHTYDQDEVVTIQAQAATGYEFEYWEGDVANPNQAQTTVTMDRAKTVTAFFSEINYDLTMAVDPAGGGTTIPTVGLHTYGENEVVTIQAEAAAGYQFDHWEGDAANPNQAETTVTMDGDKTVTAFFLDVLPPDTSITAHPADPSNSAYASFSFITNEPGSTFECQLDGGAFTACTNPHAYTSLADGYHTFQVRAVDGAGNPDPTPAGYSWTIDTLAPDTIILVHPPDPSNNTTASFSFESTETGSTFECRLVGGSYVACSSPQTYNELADGEYTFQVRATDGVGNPDLTPAEFTWTIDTQAPDTSISVYPPNPSNSAGASFSFDSDDSAATFWCSLDGGDYEACNSPQNYVGLEDGEHTFQVQAVDVAGNPDPTPAVYVWTIDTLAPDTFIDAYPDDPSYTDEALFSFSSDDPGATFECRLDGGEYAACSDPKVYSDLAEGEHTFQVRAIDEANNPDSTPAEYEWIVDLIAPSIDLTKTAEPAIVNVGDLVTFTLGIENTGDSNLDEVVVEDNLDGCTLDGPEGDEGDGILQPGEVWTYTCSIVAGMLDIDNTALVQTEDLAGGSVGDGASAHVDVIHPAISLLKTANPTVVNVGDPVDFTLEVKNTGDSLLSNVSVEDDLSGCALNGPTGDDGDALLEKEETWIYTCSVIAGSDDIQNTASVEAEDEADGTVGATDGAQVDVIHSAIQIEKTPDQQTIMPGQTATFDITVSNTGDAGLVDVYVFDDQTPNCDRVIGMVDVGDSVSYSCNIANVTAGFTNLVWVSGEPATGTPVTDSDTAVVVVRQPGPPPEFTSTPALEATLGRPYTYTISTNYNTSSLNVEAGGVEDATSGQVTITADLLPAWLNLNDRGDGTALLSGMPLAADVFPVQLRVEDLFGQSDIQKFDITVTVAPAPQIEFRYYLPQILK